MSQKQEFHRLARDKGILSPDVQYERREKAYSIRVILPLRNETGYSNPAIGVYTSLKEADERLEDDIRAFLRHYPEAIDKVTKRYHSVTKDELNNENDTRQEAAYNLLKALQNPRHNYYLDTYVADMAKQTLDYLRHLEKAQPSTTAKGTYTSKLPDQPKSAIEWEQPSVRQHPVYSFDITCPYCGDEVTIERHSPREPRHCEKEGCGEEHRRILARERKRRQRGKKTR